MRRVIRENALCLSAAVLGSAAIAWLGLYGFAWNDYEVEAKPAFDALVGGHLASFLSLAPVYGGSLVERAPFALLPGLWGGGPLAVYRMVAVPCLAGGVALGVWLVARMRAEGHSTLARGVALGLCVANPLTLRALELGHPEELLGASLCVLAVLMAGTRRPLAAGLLLGLAIANKEWAVLAAGPVVLALPPGLRLRGVATATAVAGAVLAPLVLGGSGGFVSSTRAIASAPATIFQPWQIWWFLGHHGPLVHGLFGAPKPGYRVGPAWTGRVSHPLIVLVGALAAIALWRPRARAAAQLPERDALLALALVMLLRCVLDTWDTGYYLLPFLMALLAWEVTQPSSRPPLLALGTTVLAWLSFEWLPGHGSADVQSAFFLAWSLPLAAGLGLSLYSRRRHARDKGLGARQPARAQSTTVSALGRPVSTS
jgi:hypothetical protein